MREPYFPVPLIGNQPEPERLRSALPHNSIHPEAEFPGGRRSVGAASAIGCNATLEQTPRARSEHGADGAAPSQNATNLLPRQLAAKVSGESRMALLSCGSVLRNLRIQDTAPGRSLRVV